MGARDAALRSIIVTDPCEGAVLAWVVRCSSMDTL